MISFIKRAQLQIDKKLARYLKGIWEGGWHENMNCTTLPETYFMKSLIIWHRIKNQAGCYFAWLISMTLHCWICLVDLQNQYRLVSSPEIASRGASLVDEELMVSKLACHIPKHSSNAAQRNLKNFINFWG